MNVKAGRRDEGGGAGGTRPAGGGVRLGLTQNPHLPPGPGHLIPGLAPLLPWLSVAPWPPGAWALRVVSSQPGRGPGGRLQKRLGAQ